MPEFIFFTFALAAITLLACAYRKNLIAVRSWRREHEAIEFAKGIYLNNHQVTPTRVNHRWS